MTLHNLITLIQQYGYFALFFALWLGIVGMPIPDEVIVMFAGAITSDGLLLTVPAFLLTYAGVISGLSLGYFIGKFVGSPAIEKLRKKKRFQKPLERSEELINKYGSYALCFSYFLPLIRHIIPYMVGMAKMPFSRYAIFSYSAGLLWTIFFFATGKLVGHHIDKIGFFVHKVGWNALWIFVILAVIYFVVRYFLKKRKVSE